MRTPKGTLWNNEFSKIVILNHIKMHLYLSWLKMIQVFFYLSFGNVFTLLFFPLLDNLSFHLKKKTYEKIQTHHCVFNLKNALLLKKRQYFR